MSFLTRAAHWHLAFCYLPNEDDTLVGFDGTPWHAHGLVQFSTGKATYIACDELDILVGLGTGALVVVSLIVKGEIKDRWIAHRDEPLDLQYMKPDEQIWAWRLPEVQPS